MSPRRSAGACRSRGGPPGGLSRVVRHGSAIPASACLGNSGFAGKSGFSGASGEPSGCPRRSERRFSTISGRFSGRFSRFFEVTSRERLNSRRDGPNLCFCQQAQYFGGFADFTEKPKINENRRKIAPTTLRERTARKQIDFFRSWTRLAVDFGLLGALPDAPGRPFWRPEVPLDSLRTLPGRTEDAPRRSRDAIGMLLVATGRPERLPGPVMSRFWVPRAAPGTDFASSFVSICASIFVRILPAS